CPANCTCDQSTKSISCTNQVRVPPNLPAFTRSLYLSHNWITGISNNSFINLLNLTVLGLSDNEMTSIETGAFKGFRGSVNLKMLHLKSLFIANIEGLFYGLTSLETLSLSNNRISVVNITAFPRTLLKNLDRLNLSGNPFECSCALLWFVD
ncbi:hypothetical protein CAPTEDRAFT_66563, partial [Capitella teleta]